MRSYGLSQFLRNMCVLGLLCSGAAIASSAQSFSLLYTFTSTSVGYGPYSAPIQGLDGNLYGTTSLGGAHQNGTIYKVSPAGELTTLHSFCSQSNCPDGWFPTAQLIQATDGNFYGTTNEGGTVNDICLEGCGTIFRITPSGVMRVLYRFCADVHNSCTDGQFPLGRLVQATDGNFYGTTLSGGQWSWGTVFRLTPAGILTTLYSFCPSESTCPDGSEPSAGLIQASDGNLYGTTSGDTVLPNCLLQYSCGTVFQMALDGTLTTIYSFCAQTNCTDGRNPAAGLIQASDGNFYGATAGGGANSNSDCQQGCGTFFKLTTGGELTTIYSFCSQANCADGSQPTATPIQGTDGNFYGTASTGGAYGGEYYGGAIYQVSSDSTVRTLLSFNDSTGNSEPAGLFQDTNGTFYGTNVASGSNFGYIYKMNMGLGPFVSTLPTSAPVGATVLIKGTNFKGVTSVSFNGTPATFTLFSSTEIKTTVPSGATTGTVTVALPHSTLSSNVAFNVTP